jgi:hypothetical protein
MGRRHRHQHGHRLDARHHQRRQPLTPLLTPKILPNDRLLRRYPKHGPDGGETSRTRNFRAQNPRPEISDISQYRTTRQFPSPPLLIKWCDICREADAIMVIC